MKKVLFSFLKEGFSGKSVEKTILVVGGIGVVLLGIVFSFSINKLIDFLIPHGDKSGILEMLVWLGSLVVAIFVIQLIRAQAVVRLSATAQHRWLSQLWSRILTMPLSFFRTYSVGDLLYRLQGVGESVQFYRVSTVSMIFTGVFSVLIFFVLFFIDPPLMIQAFFILGPLLILLAGGIYWQYLTYVANQKVISRLSGFSYQLVLGVAKLKTTASQSRALARWEALFLEKIKLQTRFKLLKELQTLFFLILPNVVVIAMLAHLHSEHLGVKFGVGRVLFLMMMFTQWVAALGGLYAVVSDSIPLVSLFERLRPLLAEDITVESSFRRPVASLQGKLEVVGLSYAYDRDQSILNDISFSVGAGQFLAIVGPSGCGKSTLLNLLMGFEHPNSGSIYFDGQDLSDLELQSLRQHFGVVLQDGVLFTGSVLSNIIGGLHLPEERAWEAAGLAGIAEDIRQMPMGMHTLLPDSGRSLSGGQRQRLMIARALVHRPSMIFLDEATSALDTLTQAHVASQLEALKITRIVVAHRLSTIKNADQILVLNQGQIVQKGSYQELVAVSGLFHQLVTRQL